MTVETWPTHDLVIDNTPALKGADLEFVRED